MIGTDIVGAGVGQLLSPKQVGSAQSSRPSPLSSTPLSHVSGLPEPIGVTVGVFVIVGETVGVLVGVRVDVVVGVRVAVCVAVRVGEWVAV